MPAGLITEKIDSHFAPDIISNPSKDDWVHFNKMYRLLMDIASGCINISRGNIQDAIQKALADIGRFVNADRAYIFKYDFDQNIGINTHEWCSKDITPQIDHLQGTPLEDVQEWLNLHKARQSIQIPDVSALPSGALKQILEPQEIKSLLSVPIFDGRSLEGFIGFDSVKIRHTYKKTEIDLVCFFSQILVNLKKRDLSEKALYKSQLRYQNIIENSLDVIMLTNPDGTIAYVSPSCRNVLGYSPDELIGRKTWIHHGSDGAKVKKMLKRVFRGKAGSSFEYRIVTPDNETKWISHSWSSISSGSELKLIISIIKDISQIKQAEREKLEALSFAAEQRQQALVGQVAGKMAHDFNNVLGVIMGNAQIAMMHCESGIIKEKLNLIFDQTVQGKNLTRNLVAFARDQEPKQDYFQINEKVELVVNLLKKDLEGIRVSVDMGVDLPDILADPGMTEQTLVNLMQNAVHAVSLTENPVIELKTCERNHKICCEISDNGCGIDKKHLGSIFDPSFTLKGSRDVKRSYAAGIKGTGYGMANVKKFINQHKGTISVKSKPDRGTKVALSFPIIEKKLTPAEKKLLETSRIQSNKSILLVEDEPAISAVQKYVLSSSPCSHKVDVAVNGQEAISLWEKNVYDFISLDYMLPGKTNGMDVYRHIRKKDKKIPVLFISGNIEFLESIKDLKQKDSRVDHISKPCLNEEYVRAVNDLIVKAG